MKQVFFCCQCSQIFHSTADNPERCNRCGSEAWDKLKKYPNLFDMEVDD